MAVKYECDRCKEQSTTQGNFYEVRLRRTYDCGIVLEMLLCRDCANDVRTHATKAPPKPA